MQTALFCPYVIKDSFCWTRHGFYALVQPSNACQGPAQKLHAVRTDTQEEPAATACYKVACPKWLRLHCATPKPTTFFREDCPHPPGALQASGWCQEAKAGDRREGLVRELRDQDALPASGQFKAGWAMSGWERSSPSYVGLRRAYLDPNCM